MKIQIIKVCIDSVLLVVTLILYLIERKFFHEVKGRSQIIVVRKLPRQVWEKKNCKSDNCPHLSLLNIH